jgi:hypothetical protein
LRRSNATAAEGRVALAVRGRQRAEIAEVHVAVEVAVAGDQVIDIGCCGDGDHLPSIGECCDIGQLPEVIQQAELVAESFGTQTEAQVCYRAAQNRVAFADDFHHSQDVVIKVNARIVRLAAGRVVTPPGPDR